VALARKNGGVDSLLAQTPALIGVLLGALSTILATSVSERLKWRRSLSVRWDELRLQAYIDYARAIKGTYAAATRLAAWRQPALSLAPLDPDTGRTRLAEADEQRTKSWESVLLLGDAAAVHAARQWRAAVWQLERLATDDERVGDALLDEWRSLSPAVDLARDRFYEAARQGLLVPGGPVSQAPWLAVDAPWRTGQAPQDPEAS
jgi:hypothetical protein